jgi:diphthamide biosynthesis protein 7
MAATLHNSLFLDLNACSAEFCPSPSHTDLLAIGTYQLQDKEQDEHHGERIGRLHLYLFNIQHRGEEEGPQYIAQLSLSHAEPSSTYLPGIFDLKWSRDEGTVLGAAMADGSLRLFELTRLSSHIGLQEKGRCQACTEPNDSALQQKTANMSLSLDWDPFKSSRIAVSGSSGSISIVRAAEGKWERETYWQAHNLEAWCAAYSLSHPNVIYSGSDDSMLKAWDLRTRLDPSSSAPQCLFSDRKAHSAGVCTISPHPLSPHLIATGSYDEKVRVWDERVTSKPLLIGEYDTGGGNWRLRWHPSDPSLLLAACMHNGAVLMEWKEESLKAICSYQGHESITYGADWYRGQVGDQGKMSMLAATCSFYDRSLHIWSPS